MGAAAKHKDLDVADFAQCSSTRKRANRMMISSIAPNVLDRDSVVAIIHREGRYLLQHREDRAEIAYQDWWSLFGGGREGRESAAEAIKRELLEELELAVPSTTPVFIACLYERGSSAQAARKIYFDVAISQQAADALILLEGQGMAWLTFAEVCGSGRLIVPYDLGAVALHHAMLTQPQSMLRISHPF